MSILKKEADTSKTKKSVSTEKNKMLAGNLNFAAAEAYNLLRTNIVFSFPQTEEKVCRVIGITSAMRGEGKSITSINLSYALAKDNKKVLLMECDLRLPTLAKRLSLLSSPGVSNVLVGLCSVAEALQVYEENKNLHIITSGNIPPNPSELIGSQRMEQLIMALKSNYDYIILDLPPVNVVVDGLVASKYTDGMVVVVREGYTDNEALSDSIYQLKFANAKLLGFVYNAAGGTHAGYGKYKKKYYKHYSSDYRNENYK